MRPSFFISPVLAVCLLLASLAFSQASVSNGVLIQGEAISKIRKEGLDRSQLMPTLSYLTDVVGARLTGSPSMKEANEWTRDILEKWGLQNAHLEAWGPFGRGWAVIDFRAQVVSPELINVIAYPKAWSPSTKGMVTGEVVHVDIKSEADYARYKGKLQGKIILVSSLRPLKAQEDPLAARFTDSTLNAMAQTAGEADNHHDDLSPSELKAMVGYFNRQAARMRFLMDEGAAVMIDNSPQGSGGTLFVQGANLALDLSPDIRSVQDIFDDKSFQPYRQGAEAYMLPQLTLATEDYNRLLRMIGLGVTPEMNIEIKAEYYDADEMGYNTIAEIPGTDPELKDEIVMMGAHLDSWHASTGATDNAAGCAVVMEAARIILAAGLKPRRTIRIALWSGEEQGLLGSSAYVRKHFGHHSNGEVIKGNDYDKLSAYYNLDNGTGRIRGIYLQGNKAVKPYFGEWLKPFYDLDARTLTLSNTGGTDHLPFDAIGLPGFQFIQDEIEYMTRTHHSNQDNFDRVQEEDLKQAATIMAAIAYQTAMADDKMPRKTVIPVEYLKD